MNNKQIQHLLAYLGYYGGNIDGDIGPQTRGAVRRFQEGFGGIAVDGDPGPETQQALKHAVAVGIPERDQTEDNEDVTDNNVGGNDQTGSFWDEIEFFDHSEFKCTCGGRGCNGFPVEPVERLVRNLETTRKHFGKVVPVSSGVRCQLRNSELPGSDANSLHMRGKAADFAVTGINSSVTLAYIKTLPNVDECYAIDGSYVHMGVLKY